MPIISTDTSFLRPICYKNFAYPDISFLKKLVHIFGLVYIYQQLTIFVSNIMAKTKLIVSGPAGVKEAFIPPAGAILGRSVNCDIILGHDSISRNHARISQDPFGRWIVEDLKSHNGIFIDGKRIEAQAILPGQEFTIAPFTLSLAEKSDQYTTSATTVHFGQNIVIMKFPRGCLLS